jgi:Pentapeptide repeats (8 copies)
MTQDDPSQILLRGAKVWNAWREHHRGPLNFAAPRWYDSPGRGGVQVKGRNRLDFSEMNLSGLMIHGAFAEGLNLRNTVFDAAHFEEGDFSRADFTGASFRSTRFNKTILTDANFDGATFVNCSLNRINLVGASFRVKEISETVVYGIAAWDLQTSDQMKQSKLVIERTYDLYSDIIQQGKVPLMVDDIELAQFVYYLSGHKKMRAALNILNDKGVLLLGRFKDGGLERLYSIRERLQSKGYMVMIFDFARPDNLSFTDTVVTMAGLSKFVVVDLSGSSVPAELQSIVSQFKKPILAFGDAYSLFPDVANHTDVLTIEGGDDSKLLNDLEERLPDLESLHAKRIVDLARSYEKAEKERLESVKRVGG